MYRLIIQPHDRARPAFTGDPGTLLIGRDPACGLRLHFLCSEEPARAALVLSDFFHMLGWGALFLQFLARTGISQASRCDFVCALRDPYALAEDQLADA